VRGLVEGIPSAHYAHDRGTLGRACRAAGIERFEAVERDWGGRRRLVLRIDVP